MANENFTIKKNEPKTISCDFDFCDLYIQAEGGWDGWYHHVWAKIAKDEDGDYIELSLGDQVSNGTTFRDNDGSTPKSWVGDIEVWHRTWGKDDAESWAEEFNLNPEDFDSDKNCSTKLKAVNLTDALKKPSRKSSRTSSSTPRARATTKWNFK